jgi:hypothetical protein
MEKIEVKYKNARIEYDTRNEEWVAYLNTDESNLEDEFKRNTSLQKLKDAIDRFNTREFKSIPVFFFDISGEIRYAEILSFTEVENVCWIKHSNGYRTGQKEKIKVGYTKTIYSCENIINEPKVLELISLSDEIDKKSDELQTLKRDRTHLIAQLQVFDVSGFTKTSE